MSVKIICPIIKKRVSPQLKQHPENGGNTQNVIRSYKGSCPDEPGLHSTEGVSIGH